MSAILNPSRCHPQKEKLVRTISLDGTLKPATFPDRSIKKSIFLSRDSSS
jgi:hypothetical protein